MFPGGLMKNTPQQQQQQQSSSYANNMDRPQTTYDELRAKHRAEMQQKFEQEQNQSKPDDFGGLYTAPVSLKNFHKSKRL